MLTGCGACRYSPAVLESPPGPAEVGPMNEVTAGSPPTSRLTSVPEHGLDLNLSVCVILVPAGTSCEQAGVTIVVRFGPGLGVPVPCVRTKPLQVVGVSVALLPPALGGGGAVSHPVVPGTCVPGADRLSTPHPKPVPPPSQSRFGAL